MKEDVLLAGAAANGGLFFRLILQNCSSWRGPYTEAREKCEKEGEAKRNSHELTTTPYSRLLCAPQSRGGGGKGIEN